MGNSSGPEIAIIVIGLLSGILVALWIWMLLECALYESSEGNTKIVWIVILVTLNWIGALLYFFIRRPQRKAELGR